MAPLQSGPVELSAVPRRVACVKRGQRWIRGPSVRINRVRLIASAERGHYGEPLHANHNESLTY